MIDQCTLRYVLNRFSLVLNTKIQKIIFLVLCIIIPEGRTKASVNKRFSCLQHCYQETAPVPDSASHMLINYRMP